MIKVIDVVESVGCLVLEFAENGSLHSYLESNTTGVGWLQRLSWASQIADGMIYLHNRGLRHGLEIVRLHL